MSRSGRQVGLDPEIHYLPLTPVSRGVEPDRSPASNRSAGSNSNQDALIGDDRTYDPRLESALGQSDFETLNDIGMFHVVAVEDLARHRYGNDAGAADRHLKGLALKGLIRRRANHSENIAYVTLTRAGYRLLTASLAGKASGQRHYYGFVKPREARHDSALYRLYQQEVERIIAMGGRVRRVVLDFELKQSINRRTADFHSLSPEQQARYRQEIAREHGLEVVQNKIPLPDLRLEYETPNQELAKVDLELVTRHYHHSGLAAKARAGFAMYAFAEDAARLRPALEDPEIMRDILSL